jgi:hypothetical protein
MCEDILLYGDEVILTKNAPSHAALRHAFANPIPWPPWPVSHLIPSLPYVLGPLYIMEEVGTISILTVLAAPYSMTGSIVQSCSTEKLL